MKKGNIVDLFVFLSCCYPMEFKDMGKDRLEQMVNAWFAVFRDERFSNLGQSLMESARRHVMGNADAISRRRVTLLSKCPLIPSRNRTAVCKGGGNGKERLSCWKK